MTGYGPTTTDASHTRHSVTVVICAYTEDRWTTLQSAITSVLSQTRPPAELIVSVDHNPRLHDRLVAEAAGQYTVVTNTGQRGLSGARNAGVASATGNIIVFLDDDAAAEPCCLEHLIQPFSDSSVAGTAAWIEPDWPDTRPAWWPPTFDWVVGCSYEGLPGQGARVRNPIGAGMAIRRELLEELGGFTLSVGRVGRTPLGCEETELAIRLTAAHPDMWFVHVTSAVVRHKIAPYRVTPTYFLRRCAAEGRSKGRVALLVDSRQALASERVHVFHTLPHAMWSDVRDSRDTLPALARSLATIAGAVVTATSYFASRLHAYHPITTRVNI